MAPKWYDHWTTRAGLLVHFCGEHKFSTADISHTSCCSATKCGSGYESMDNGHLFPELGEVQSICPAIPCGSMHQSFTDALVCDYLLNDVKLQLVACCCFVNECVIPSWCFSITFCSVEEPPNCLYLDMLNHGVYTNSHILLLVYIGFLENECTVNINKSYLFWRANVKKVTSKPY